jgi:hypothetical protein
MVNTPQAFTGSRFRFDNEGFSPAAGLKRGQFDRSRNFGNVSHDVVTKK